MKKALLIISIIFIILCSAVAIITLAAAGWSLERVFSPAVRESYEITDEFQDILVSVDTADVRLQKSDDGKTHVECVERYKITHTASVKDGTLKIERRDERKWYEHIAIIPVHFEITVYLPEGEWGKLNISTSTGDTEIPSCFAFSAIDIKQSTGDISLSATASGKINLYTSTGDISVTGSAPTDLTVHSSTGDVNISDVTASGKIEVKSYTGKHNFTNIGCASLIAEADTGDAILTNVIASGVLSVERSTGDVRLDSVDAAEIYINTDTGNVTGTLLSEKIIFATTDTGDIDVPKCTSGGKCEIETDTGNIKIHIK